jgi:hypothetical protein
MTSEEDGEAKKKPEDCPINYFEAPHKSSAGGLERVFALN